MIRWEVPGRIEVLGKHTDYGGGRVLVCAVERAVTVSVQERDGEAGEIVASTTEFPGEITVRAGEDPQLPAGHWGKYVHTVVERLTRNFGPLKPARVTISSTLPPASGMSSSSAFLTGTALALADLNGLTEREEWKAAIADRVDLAGYAASIENGKSFKSLEGNPGVGTSGGSLDHTGMLTSEVGQISFAEFDPMHIIERVAMPEGFRFVIAVSGVLAEKTGAAREAYNRGPRVLGEVLEAWNAREKRSDGSLNAAVRHLVGEAMNGALEPSDSRLDPLRACAGEGYPERRLHQFLEESYVLAPRAIDALTRGDVSAFGAIVEESQSLSETHLENQVPQTIDLVRIARELGAPAASAFGAGFGGSVWALVPEEEAEQFEVSWLERYRDLHNESEARTIVTGAGAPARRLND